MALGACALLALAFAATAGARAFGGHGHRGPLGHLEEVLPSLGLDAETEEAIYAEIDAARESRRANREEVREAHELLRDLIQQDEPDRLSSISRVYRGDVETIVAKSLEKDRVRRYQTAAELATDIQRFLQDEPIGSKGVWAPPPVRLARRRLSGDSSAHPDRARSGGPQAGTYLY